ncbi:hypothetical protein H5410_014234 [Solanum commersonii]|uniref:Uncharacterized protein n=1 Tax=Solanum commersonii TaxID=4109 RepID=A0A9J5ZQR5_SOLCO|nr:hypothetical protein H5410_014234 [Solanum commersonii]
MKVVASSDYIFTVYEGGIDTLFVLRGKLVNLVDFNMTRYLVCTQWLFSRRGILKMYTPTTLITINMMH